MFLIGGQTAGLVGVKVCTWIHLDPGSVLVKSRSAKTRAKSNAVGVRMEVPCGQRCQDQGEGERNSHLS